MMLSRYGKNDAIAKVKKEKAIVAASVDGEADVDGEKVKSPKLDRMADR
jgi:hypothetical protein